MNIKDLKNFDLEEIGKHLVTDGPNDDGDSYVFIDDPKLPAKLVIVEAHLFDALYFFVEAMMYTGHPIQEPLRQYFVDECGYTDTDAQLMDRALVNCLRKNGVMIDYYSTKRSPSLDECIEC
jgi:hypothetical protein